MSWILIDHNRITYIWIELDEIMPFSSVSVLMSEPSISVRQWGYNMRNFGLYGVPLLHGYNMSNLRQCRVTLLSLYPLSAPLANILTFSSVSPVLPNPSTYLSISLPRFRSINNSKSGNQIEQIGQLTPISASEPAPSNLMPQLSIS